MGLLSNPAFEFVINIILISISIWIAWRRPPQISISYETFPFDYVDSSNEDVKRILAKRRKASDDPRMQLLTFVTFKLSNMGKEAISLNDVAKPLTIAFNRDATILSCEKVETIPEDLEYKSPIKGEKVLLTFPLLEPKDSLTLRLLITGYIDYFPGITIRVGLRKRIVRANNVRFSKELLVMGIVCLCLATFMASASASPPQLPLQNVVWDMIYGYYVIGLGCLVVSRLERRALPTRHILPSAFISNFFKMFIRVLPFLISFGLLSIAVFHWFGRLAFAWMFLIVVFVAIPLGAWDIFYKVVIKWLQKKKRKYNAVLIGLLVSIPFIALYLMFVYRTFWIFFLYGK
jgi:hypothetical protein